jgi:23S rRNA (uridine2552-2'-O)-methyltransferase
MKTYRDHYFKRAKQESWPARSVYKLEEIDSRFKVLAPGQKVLDLGAAPGSWTLFAAKKVGPRGRVLGIDLAGTATALPENARIIRGDVFAPPEEVRAAIEEAGPFDLVLSDMAPSTTGHRSTDQARSMALAEEALALASRSLVMGGHFVVKVFMGPDVPAFVASLRSRFETVKTFKPKSSRAESKEQFVIGLSFRGTGTESPSDI